MPTVCGEQDRNLGKVPINMIELRFSEGQIKDFKMEGQGTARISQRPKRSFFRESSERGYSHRVEDGHNIAIFTCIGTERTVLEIEFFGFVAISPADSNAMRHCMAIWDEVAMKVPQDLSETIWGKTLVHAVAIFIVLTDMNNLLDSDCWIIDIAPSSSFNSRRKSPSRFEAVHQKRLRHHWRPTQRQQSKSTAAMSRQKERGAARKLMDSAERAYAAGVRTSDIAILADPRVTLPGRLLKTETVANLVEICMSRGLAHRSPLSQADQIPRKAAEVLGNVENRHYDIHRIEQMFHRRQDRKVEQTVEYRE
ncbi:hypothetical protein V8E54_010096 [Elaphomyces granulatus]